MSEPPPSSDQLVFDSERHLVFDIVIVGAGPSAAGLLRGVLLRLLSNKDHTDRGGDGGDGIDENIRIAVLERGGSSTATSSLPDDEALEGRTATDHGAREQHSAPRGRFGHPHPSTHSLQTWFDAAHYTSNPSDSTSPHSHNDGLASPTILFTSTPQAHLNCRILDVPTGSGWGGTTNIHAGLVVEPDYEHDFEDWPGRWRGGNMMKGSRGEVLQAMGEGGALDPREMNRSGDEIGGVDDADVTIAANDRGIVGAFVEGLAGGSAQMGALEECGMFHRASTSSSSNAAAKADALSNEGIPASSTRVNYFSALVEPLLQQHPELEANVTFLSGMAAERILIGEDGLGDQSTEQRKAGNQPDRAWAVECLASTNTSNSEVRQVLVRATSEIILCAGAIGTPALLLASGIGHEDDLRAAGIAPWYERPSSRGQDRLKHRPRWRQLPVGRNLRDHLVLPRVFVTPRQNEAATSRNSIHGWWMYTTNHATIQLQLADGVQMHRMLSHFAAAAVRRGFRFLPVAWVQATFDQVRRLLTTMFDARPFREWARRRTAAVNVCILNPRSTGRVTIARRDETASVVRLSECRVIVDPGYLSDRRDVDALWRGWTASTNVKGWIFGGCSEILPGLPLVALFSLASYLHFMIRWEASWLGWLLGRGTAIAKRERKRKGATPAWFDGYAAEFANPYYHWCGTCAMGEEASSGTMATPPASSFVVDETLRVRGIAGLRVCDASVLPRCVSAPTALTCTGLGYAASSLLVEQTEERTIETTCT